MTHPAAELLDLCRSAGFRLATAESCTGGLIAAALTAPPGASDVFDRGFVTYSNAAKITILAVPSSLIEAHGAVSEPVARMMAVRALTRSDAHVAVSVTGIAGPGGGSADKPVGLVWFGLSRRDGETITQSRVFPGDRDAVREATVLHALAMIRASVTA